MSEEDTNLRSIASRWFGGSSPEGIAADLGLDRERVASAIERLRSVILLLEHGFPENLVGEAARIGPGEATLWVHAIRKVAKSPAELHELARATAQGAGLPASGETPPAKPAAPGDEASQALDVLDFWASKWL